MEPRRMRSTFCVFVFFAGWHSLKLISRRTTRWTSRQVRKNYTADGTKHTLSLISGREWKIRSKFSYLSSSNKNNNNKKEEATSEKLQQQQKGSGGREEMMDQKNCECTQTTECIQTFAKFSGIVCRPHLYAGRHSVQCDRIPQQCWVGMQQKHTLSFGYAKILVNNNLFTFFFFIYYISFAQIEWNWPSMLRLFGNMAREIFRLWHWPDL